MSAPNHNPPRWAFVKVPRIADARGSLGFVEYGSHLPFLPARAFFLYDNVRGLKRGGHAHRQCTQFIMSMAGSFQLRLDNGKALETMTLAQRDVGLNVPPGIWVDLENFSEDAVCLVLASHRYDEADYIRDRAEFDSLNSR